MYDTRHLEPIRTFRNGRLCWLFGDGTVLPCVRGGNGEVMTPEEIDAALENLAELSDEDLDRLRGSIRHHYEEVRGDPASTPSADDLEVLRGLAADATAVDGEVANREAAAAERRDELARLDAEMNGEPADEDEDDGEGDEPAPEGDQAETPEPEPQPEPAPEAIAASASPSRRRSLAALSANQPRTQRASAPSELGLAVITASADVTGMGGRRITTAEDFGRALATRWNAVRNSRPQGEIRYPAMAIEPHVPGDFMVPDTGSPHVVSEIMDRAVAHFMARVNERTAALRDDDRTVLLASGGPCVPNERSFDVPFVASNATPFTDGVPSVRYTRNGVDFYPPVCFDRAPSRTQATVGTTNGSAALTAPANAFTSNDVGRRITGTGIPAGTTILSVTTAGSGATMSANATATGSITATLIGRSGNIARVITPAQDTAGYASQGGTTPDKACVRVDCPTSVSCDLNMLLLCMTIGNWIDRTFPEYVSVWRESVGVAYAQAWEEHHIGQVVAGSVAMTGGAAVFGATRDLLGQGTRMLEHIRSSRRLGDGVMFRWWVPAWTVQALKLDLMHSIGGTDAGSGYANFNITDAQLVGWFRTKGINLSTFIDEAGGASNGSTVLPSPTTGAVPQFPAGIRSMLYREGSWVRGQGGTLNIGVIRDSQTLKTNDLQTFQETESKMCYRGCPGESYVIDHTVEYSGLAAGLIDPTV